MKKYLKMGVLTGLVGFSFSANALLLDLTTAGNSGAINSALFFQYTEGGAGSGAVDDFVRYDQSNSITQGYNTDFRPVEYNENSSATFTHSINLSDVPIINISGINYLEFGFDVNEPGGAGSTLSLDMLNVYLAGSWSLTNHQGGLPNFSGNATEIYDLDSGTDNRVELDGNVSGSGSGKLDMLFYLPESLVTAVGTYGADPFIYLYSKVGVETEQNSGFEAWVISTEGGITPVPIPAAVWLFGSALFGLVGIGRRQVR